MSGVGAFLSRPVGPLPMGVWLLVGAGGLVIAWRSAEADGDTAAALGLGVDPILVTRDGEQQVEDEAPYVISPIFRIPDIINNVIVPPGKAPVVNVNVPVSVTGPPAPPRPPVLVNKPSTPTGARSHTVVRGDTLWALAARYYGNPLRWGDIYNANRGVIDQRAAQSGKPGGGHWIFPGTVLVIP